MCYCPYCGSRIWEDKEYLNDFKDKLNIYGHCPNCNIEAAWEVDVNTKKANHFTTIIFHMEEG